MITTTSDYISSFIHKIGKEKLLQCLNEKPLSDLFAGKDDISKFVARANGDINSSMEKDGTRMHDLDTVILISLELDKRGLLQDESDKG